MASEHSSAELSPDAMLARADDFAARGDGEAAFRWTTRAAKAGSAVGWTRLGRLYAKGVGTKRDHGDAAQCYTRAARQGDATGRGQLAMCIITGTGVPADVKRGLAMLRDVAEGGDITAMKNCAWIYQHGESYGVGRDVAEAKKWEAAAKAVRGVRGRSRGTGSTAVQRGRSRSKSSKGKRAESGGRAGEVHAGPSRAAAAAGAPGAAAAGAMAGTAAAGTAVSVGLKRQSLVNARQGGTHGGAHGGSDRNELAGGMPAVPLPTASDAESSDFLFDSLDVGMKVSERVATPLSSPAPPTTEMHRTSSGDVARAALEQEEIRRRELQDELERNQLEQRRRQMEQQRKGRDEAQKQKEIEAEMEHRLAVEVAMERERELETRRAEIMQKEEEEKRVRATEAAKRREAAARARLEEEERARADFLAAEERRRQTEAIRKRDEAEARAIRADAEAAAKASAMAAARADAEAARAAAAAARADVEAASALASVETEAARLRDGQVGDASSLVVPGVATGTSLRSNTVPTPARAEEEEKEEEEEEEDEEEEEEEEDPPFDEPNVGNEESSEQEEEEDDDVVGAYTAGVQSPNQDSLIPERRASLAELAVAGPGSESVPLAQRQSEFSRRPNEDAPLPHRQTEISESRRLREEARANARVNASLTASERNRRNAVQEREQQNEAAAQAFASASEVGMGDIPGLQHGSSGPGFSFGEDVGHPASLRDGSSVRDGGVGGSPTGGMELSLDQRNEYMRMARGLKATYPADLLHPKAHLQIFAFLDKMQMIAWNCREAGQFLIDDGSLNLVCRAMQTFPLDAGIQERGIHAILRLVRAADSFQRDSLLIAHSPREFPGETRPDSRQSGGSGGSGSGSSGRGGKGKLTLNPVQTIVTAMRAHPEVMTLQLAGCNVLATFVSFGGSVRSLVVDYRGHIAVVDALRVRGRAVSFDRLYFVHEVACKALCEMCGPPDGSHFREIVGDAAGVEQVVGCLGRWNLRNDVPRDARITVTRHACAALGLLTAESERNSRRALNAKALLMLVRVLEANGEHEQICQSAIEAMAATSAVDGEAASADLEASNALTSLVIVIRRHMNNPALVRKGLQCIRLFCSFGTLSRRRAIDAGAIDTCLAPMRKYPGDANLQEHACGALAVLCRDESVAKGLATRGGVVNLLTGVLRNHGDDVAVIEQASSAITSTCAQHPENLESARQLDTVGAIVSVLKKHSMREPGVAIVVASAIRVLALAKDPALSHRLLALSAPEMLLETMRAHQYKPKVQEHASFALSALCAKNDPLPKRISRGGAVDLLLSLLRMYMAEPSVVYALMCAIRSMVSKSREVVLQFIVSKLPEMLQTALQQHMHVLPQNDHVMVVLCATINVCGFKIVAHKNELGAAGIVEQLRELMTIASDLGDESVLRPTLSTLCTLLINSKDNQDRFQEAGGVEAVLDVSHRWGRNEAVVELCCVVLRHSCGEHDGNRDEIKANNGIRTLQEILQNHPRNAGVVTAVCQALAVICHGDHELQTAAGLNDTIPTAVAAMGSFEEMASVQAGACSFLFAVTQDNPRNKASVVRCGGRTAVVRAIEMHPANEDVNNYGAHALLQVEDTIVGQHVHNGIGPGVDGGQQATIGASDGRDGSPGGMPPQRKSGLFRGRRKSRDGRSQGQHESFDVADGTTEAPSPPFPSPSSSPGGPPSPLPESSEGGSRRKLRRRRKPAGAVETGVDERLDGGSAHDEVEDRLQDVPGPAPKRFGGTIFRRKKSASSAGSSRVGEDSDIDGTYSGTDGEGGSSMTGARRRRSSFSLIRRNSKARAPRGTRRGGEPVGDDEGGVGGGVGVGTAGHQDVGRNRHDSAPRYLAPNRLQHGNAGGIAPPGAGGRGAWPDDDNDIARMEDLDGMSIGDEAEFQNFS